jgi:hypothetical protein
MTEPLVTCVYVIHRRADDVLESLKSLSEQTYVTVQAVLVDNAAEPSESDRVRAAFPDVNVLETGANLGFTGGNNCGMAWALENGTDYVMLINDDTRLAPDMITWLVAAAESDPAIGAAGPKIYHADHPETIQAAGVLLHGWADHETLCENAPDAGQCEGIHDVDYVTGCAMLLRRAALEEVGLLDPAFFIYWEETDLCKRIKDSGRRVVCARDAHIWHKGAQPGSKPTPFLVYLMTRNRLYYLRKHGAPLRVLLRYSLCNLRTVLSWSVKPRWREKRPALRDAMFGGLIAFWRGETGPPPMVKKRT